MRYTDVLVLGCVNASAVVGQRNVYVSCELRARPDVRQLYWVIDDDGTTVAETQVVDEYWTILMVAPLFAVQIACIRDILTSFVYYVHPPRGVRSIVKSVSVRLSVCLSACI